MNQTVWKIVLDSLIENSTKSAQITGRIFSVRGNQQLDFEKRMSDL